MKTLIQGGTLVTPLGLHKAELLIDGETIAAISAGTHWTADRVVDASGCLIFPGSIDVHVHMGFTVGEFQSTDSFTSGSRAAAYGGVTTLIDFAVPASDDSLEAALHRRVQQAEGCCHVDYGVHIVINRIEPSLPEEIGRCIEHGAPSFKLFTVYPGLELDDGEILQVMEWVNEAGGLVVVHAENAAIIRTNQETLLREGKADPYSHYLSRPELVEAEAVERVLTLQEETGCPVYFVHISSAKSLAHIQEAKHRGRPVFLETCPHYLLLTSEVYRSPKGALYLVSPSIKTAQDQDGLWNGMENGVVDTVATDHCPFSLSQKEKYKQDFTQIPTGLPGVETTLPLLFTAWQDRGLPLERLVELASYHPARLFGLFPRKGSLQPGADADLVLYDPEREWRIDADKLHMNVDWNPFEGRFCQGAVRTVFLRGEPLIEEGKWVAERVRGTYQERGSFTNPN